MANNPVEEFLIEKHAFGMDKLKAVGSKVGPALGRVGEQAGNAALAGAGAAAFAGLTGAAGKLYDAATKSRDFSAMMEANPHLHDHLQADPAGFNRLFTSLRKFSPEFTKDPMVAGSLMSQGMEVDLQDRGDFVLKNQQRRVFPKSSPAADAAVGGFMKGFGGGDSKKQQLQRQTKSVFGPPSEDGAPPLQRIEETMNQYG